MTFHGVIEAIDVVLKDKAINKFLAVNLIGDDVPGRGDQQENDPAWEE